jgi:hypothetical protein
MPTTLAIQSHLLVPACRSWPVLPGFPGYLYRDAADARSLPAPTLRSLNLSPLSTRCVRTGKQPFHTQDELDPGHVYALDPHQVADPLQEDEVILRIETDVVLGTGRTYQPVPLQHPQGLRIDPEEAGGHADGVYGFVGPVQTQG